MHSVHDVADASGLDLNTLRDLAAEVVDGRAYAAHFIRQTKTSDRTVSVPGETLDSVSKNIRRFLEQSSTYVAPDFVFGFIRGRSIVDNARQHLGRAQVLRIDLKSFFSSISRQMVTDALLMDGFHPQAADLLCDLLTFRNHLPTGLSSSPHLSNIVFQESDRQIKEFAAQSSLSYSRYVDDLTFSGDDVQAVQHSIFQLIKDLGWEVNSRKTALMRRGGPQYVTGLYVGCNDRPHLSRRFKKSMRWRAHIVAKHGYSAYWQDFGGAARGHRPTVLLGLTRFVAMVEPDLGRKLILQIIDHLPDQVDEMEDDMWERLLDDPDY